MKLTGEFLGATQSVAEIDDMLRLLASNPTPEEILNLRPSEGFMRWVKRLVDTGHHRELTPREQAEWERYEQAEYLVTMAKIKAHVDLGLNPNADV